MRWWKILGLAGLLSGVALGVTLGARQVQRSRREYVDGDIHELRDRLRARFADCAALDDDDGGGHDAASTSDAAAGSVSV